MITSRKPNDINPTEINPTEIKPTEIKPTDIQPTEIKPANISASPIKPKLIIPVVLTALSALSLFIVYLSQGLSFILIVPAHYLVIFLIVDAVVLKKINLTQSEIDVWYDELRKKHPDLKTPDIKEFDNTMSKFSYWASKLPKGKSAVASVSLLVTILSIVALPITYIASDVLGFGGGDVEGVYIQSTGIDTPDGVEQVGLTAYKFEDDGTCYYTAYYDGSATNWQAGTWTKSGSSVTVSFSGSWGFSGTFKVNSSGSTLSYDGEVVYEKID